MNMLLPLLVGFAFGALLQRAGMSRYERIVEVYRLRDLAVLTFLLSALVTGALGIVALRALGFIEAVPVPPTLFAQNFVGGAVFGVGMALSGFCPGTIAAGAGEGRLDYLIPGSLGLVAGSLAFGFAYDSLVATMSHIGALGATTLPVVLEVDPWLVVALFAELSFLLFYFIERGRRSNHETVSRASKNAHHRKNRLARRDDEARHPRVVHSRRTRAAPSLREIALKSRKLPGRSG